MGGWVQTLSVVEEITKLEDNNGIYAVVKVGPFKDKESAQVYAEKMKKEIIGL